MRALSLSQCLLQRRKPFSGSATARDARLRDFAPLPLVREPALGEERDRSDLEDFSSPPGARSSARRISESSITVDTRAIFVAFAAYAREYGANYTCTFREWTLYVRMDIISRSPVSSAADRRRGRIRAPSRSCTGCTRTQISFFREHACGSRRDACIMHAVPVVG